MLFCHSVARERRTKKEKREERGPWDDSENLCIRMGKSFGEVGGGGRTCFARTSGEGEGAVEHGLRELRKRRGKGVEHVLRELQGERAGRTCFVRASAEGG